MRKKGCSKRRKSSLMRRKNSSTSFLSAKILRQKTQIWLGQYKEWQALWLETALTKAKGSPLEASSKRARIVLDLWAPMAMRVVRITQEDSKWLENQVQWRIWNRHSTKTQNFKFLLKNNWKRKTKLKHLLSTVGPLLPILKAMYPRIRLLSTLSLNRSKNALILIQVTRRKRALLMNSDRQFSTHKTVSTLRKLTTKSNISKNFKNPNKTGISHLRHSIKEAASLQISTALELPLVIKLLLLRKVKKFKSKWGTPKKKSTA